MTNYYDREHRLHLVGGPGGGWRDPQRGAVAALVAHWSKTSGEASLVSLPTGTGKTAVAMAAPLVMSPPPRRVLVLVPSQVLRTQITDEFASQDLLKRLGVLDTPDDGLTLPVVHALAGRVDRWDELHDADVIVALPNSISPHHYEDTTAGPPPPDLFDLVIIDEAHHTPAATWRAVLDYFSWRRALLLTATPIRRDRRPVPGELVYHYPLRRALDEGLYHAVQPDILPPPEPYDRAEADRQIAQRAAQLLDRPEHATSTLIVRGLTVQRLQELRELYGEFGVDLPVLHNRLGEVTKQRMLDDLRAGAVRAIAVAGMLGEGFDLPSIRIAAYHDKHKAVPATIQLIGRLARASSKHPQQSRLITVADHDVYPALKGAVRDLYANEDRDWSRVLPGLIDDHIEAEQQRASFVAEFPPDTDTPVDLRSLVPLKRVVIFEVPDNDYRPFFTDEHAADPFARDAAFAAGRVVYAGTHQAGGLYVVVSEHRDRPRWSLDPQMASRTYELHLLAYRAPIGDEPGLLFVNTSDQRAQRALLDALQLPRGSRLVDPDRINDYLDALPTLSVSAVGVRTTTMSGHGGTAYRNYMGSGVDRGLRRSDTAGAALGHVNLQFSGAESSSNGGAAMEKAKIWVTNYVHLVEYADWIDGLAAGLRSGHVLRGDALLPTLDRGRRLTAWPSSPPLAADLSTRLWGLDLEVECPSGRRVPIEDVLLYVARDPLGRLDGEAPSTPWLPIVAATTGEEPELAWSGLVNPTGTVVDEELVLVHHGTQTHSFGGLLEQDPPTIYFLDGTTTVGPIQYDSRASFRSYNPHELRTHDWTDANIEAESRTAAQKHDRGMSVHEALEDWLLMRNKRGEQRWLLCNDGAGEIADYILIEETVSGELYLGLWHAKASSGPNPGLRIDDLQEVVSQTARSGLHFNRGRDLWESLAKRLDGSERPKAELVDGSDSEESLRARLGLTADVPASESWVDRNPRVRAELGIAQPGLAKSQLIAAARNGKAASFLQLLSVAIDAAEFVGGELTVLASNDSR